MKVSATAARSLVGSMLGTLALLALVALVTEGHPVSGQGGGLLVAGVGGRLPAAATQAPLLSAAAIPEQSAPTAGPTIPAVSAMAETPAAAHASLLPQPFQITSEFGHYPKGGAHYGLDIGATEGVEQYAPVGGTVEDVLRGCVFGDTTCGQGWGNHVWWKSDETGHHILLAHFNTIDGAIQAGVHITAGQLIGATGSTGYTMGANGTIGFGPHTHLQINTDGCCSDLGAVQPAWEFYWLRVDPEPVVGARFGACVPAPCK